MRSAFLVVLVLAFAGCSEHGGPAEGSKPEGKVPSVQAFPEPQPTPTLPPLVPGMYPLPCDGMYDDEVLQEFSLDIPTADLAYLRAEPAEMQAWRPAVFHHDGNTRNVMIRRRGNGGCGAKLQLVISFNEVDPEARYLGLRRILLDHGNCSILNERLALAFARDLGQPAPCANHARLDINGRFEGLFTNLEAQNKDFLKRIFGPDRNDGDLWKEGDELKTNETVSDRTRLNRFRNATSIGAIEALMLDLDTAVDEWAIEAVIPASDNFFVKGWNYYLYDHPEAGFVFLLRDFDKVQPWDSRYQKLDPLGVPDFHPVPIVLNDAEWGAKYLAAVRRTTDAYDPVLFRARIDRYWAQIRESAIEDVTLSDSPPYWIVRDMEARLAFLRGRLTSGEGLHPAPDPPSDPGDPTPIPTATAIVTPIASPTDTTPLPTPTPDVSPEPTQTPDPTPTPEATPTPDPTPEPTPTPREGALVESSARSSRMIPQEAAGCSRSRASGIAFVRNDAAIGPNFAFAAGPGSIAVTSI